MHRPQQNLKGLVILGGLLGVGPLLLAVLYFPRSPILASVMAIVAVFIGIGHNVKLYRNYRANLADRRSRFDSRSESHD